MVCKNILVYANGFLEDLQYFVRHMQMTASHHNLVFVRHLQENKTTNGFPQNAIFCMVSPK